MPAEHDPLVDPAEQAALPEQQDPSPESLDEFAGDSREGDLQGPEGPKGPEAPEGGTTLDDLLSDDGLMGRDGEFGGLDGRNDAATGGAGGSGDVLTGLVAALLAQGYEALAASQLAAYLHGLAGDIAVEHAAPESLTAGDLIEALPRAFERLREE